MNKKSGRFNKEESKESLIKKVIESKLFKRNLLLWTAGLIIMIIGAMIKNNSSMIICILGFAICTVSTSQLVGFINKIQLTEKNDNKNLE